MLVGEVIYLSCSPWYAGAVIEVVLGDRSCRHRDPRARLIRAMHAVH